ncbi:MAG: hypothetical protein JW395_2843 [Nitrospira sp.]|nr:hypothetical protein [Nitrospira sp.]
MGGYGRLVEKPRSMHMAQTDRDRMEARLRELGKEFGVMYPQGAGRPENVDLSAGYTYLGQFINHDINLTSFPRGHDVGVPTRPEDIDNLRTPFLDLDSVYGNFGPDSSPSLYTSESAGTRFRIEKLDATKTDKDDLPRTTDNTAIIPGGVGRHGRLNDENVLLAQLHLSFLKFHNAKMNAADPTNTNSPAIFEDVQQSVRWHYQWIIVNDYLKRIADPGLVEQALEATKRDIHDDPARVPAICFNWRAQPFRVPAEFTFAAFRFGHSQVRSAYQANLDWIRGPVPIFDSRSSSTPDDPFDLSGGHRAARRWVDWSTLFKINNGKPPENSRCISPTISQPLFRLPVPPGAPAPQNLPQLTLLRHLDLDLPSGQEVMNSVFPGHPPLGPEHFEAVGALNDEFAIHTPLWYYILREAELTGTINESHTQCDNNRLGLLGATLVTHVLIGLLAADPTSCLNAAPEDWRPDGGDTFGITDLFKTAAAPGAV